LTTPFYFDIIKISKDERSFVMLVRFLKVDMLDLDTRIEYDFDNADFLCAVNVSDYDVLVKALNVFKEVTDNNSQRNFGNIELQESMWDIVDINLYIPQNETELMYVNVYLSEN
jgi:hypothetical protein